MIIDGYTGSYLREVIYTMDEHCSLKHNFEIYYSQETYESTYLTG